MADTVASPLLGFISDRLCNLAGLPNSKILEKLRLTLGSIQTLVAEAENRCEDNEALKSWITAVKNAAYDADNLFDEYELCIVKRKHKVRSFFSLSLAENPLFFGFGLGRKLSGIEARLNELLSRWSAGQFSAFNASRGLVALKESSSNRYSSFVFESHVVGREVERQDLLSMVFDSGNHIIPIVGMGGMGKTTLAKLVYNEPRVSRGFELKVWVCAAQNFEAKDIGKAMMEHITGNSYEFVSWDMLETSIRGELEGKKFLIVVDNLWNVDWEKWWPLKKWFRVGAAGSKVIITSRNYSVAAMVGTVQPYVLQPLTDDESWLLFERTVEIGNPKLMEIGRRIVLKCGGLPLAITTLGGLMRSKREESEWLFIMEEDMWNLREFESHILPILRLSYDHLPSHLKQCFAYCSIFPKNCVIDKEKLIHLWIAEGFVRSAKGNKRLEEVGNDYFMELFHRSFFTDVTRDEFGEIVDCTMHELVHDLALSVASIGCSIVETESPQELSRELRYSSLVGNSGVSTVPEALHEATNLRTLLLLSCKFKSIPNIVRKLGGLRALDLSQTGILKLSGTIGALKHLRFLDLSQTCIQTLPESISNLKNLQTLELSECHNLVELPKAICELINLRILDIEECSSLSYMPSGIGNLKLLQKLPVFILGENDDCVCLDELGGLDLKGRLEIKNLEYVRDLAGALNVNLHEKTHIQSLGLSWGGQNVDLSTEISTDILESLRPSRELKVLEISGYKGSAFPSWIRHQWLPKVVRVSLTNCICQKLPPLGELPRLKELFMKGMPDVQHFGDEFYGNSSGSFFPSLEKFELYDMPNLSEWSNFKSGKAFGSTTIHESSSELLEEAFPCLNTLTVKGCRKLTVLPSFPRLKNLALWNSNEMLLCSLARLTCLSSLVIHELRKPTCMPQDLGFNSVRTLMIYDCNDLINLWDEGMQKFTCLEQLSILYCDKLSCLPLGLKYLTSLRKLDVVECPELANIDDSIISLTSLEELTIEGCPLLESLAQRLHLPTGLQKWVLKRRPKLQESLDMEYGEQSFNIDQIP